MARVQVLSTPGCAGCDALKRMRFVLSLLRSVRAHGDLKRAGGGVHLTVMANDGIRDPMKAMPLLPAPPTANADDRRDEAAFLKPCGLCALDEVRSSLRLVRRLTAHRRRGP